MHKSLPGIGTHLRDRVQLYGVCVDVCTRETLLTLLPSSLGMVISVCGDITPKKHVDKPGDSKGSGAISLE